MKLICEKADLLAAVGPATSLASKNTQAATEGIHIKAEDASCILSVYDMEKGMRAVIPATVEEAGSVIITAPMLKDFLATAEDGPVRLESDAGNNVHIISGKAKMELHGRDGKLFSILPELSGERGFTVPQKVLRRMISQVSFAVSQKDHRVVLLGAHFVVRDTQLRLVACDGNRLAIKDYLAPIDNRSLDGAALSLNFTVPGKALNELMKLLSDSEEEVTIILGRKHVIFSIGSIKFFTRLIDGDYIDYNRFVPTNFTIHAEVNTAELIAGLSRAALITDVRAVGQVRSIVSLRFEEEQLIISSSSVSGKSYDEIAIDKEGGDLHIGFNCRMLLEVIRACNTERVTLDLHTALTSMVIRPAVKEENEDFLFLCLPVKMHD